MVGKKATKKNIIIVSRNEDFTQPNWNKYMKFRQYPEYYNKDGNNPVVNNNKWTLGNGLKVPVPKKMFSYNATPDAIGETESVYEIKDHFFFEERGINQNNVAISATNSLTINENATKADPLVKVGIAECIIPTLILPQAKTAADAVSLLGAYVEKYGASEVNGILIGDPKEAWYFEIGSAHHWIAIKVPDEYYIIVANGMRVHGVDITDNNNIKHSKGLYEFVVKHKLLEKPDKHSFNFAQAFGIPGVSYNTNRIWLAQKILTPSLNQSPFLYQYPLFLKPDNPIEVPDVMEVLRATYKGTELEGVAERPIGYNKTAESHIMTIDAHMPENLMGTIWQAISTPLGAPYMPFYNVMKDIPNTYSIGDNVYDSLSAYWAFRGLYSLTIEFNKGSNLPDLQALWKEFENNTYHEREHIDAMLKQLYKSSPEQANDFAAKYSTGIAYQAVGTANNERNKLMTLITSTST